MTSNFSGFNFDLWPSEATWVKNVYSFERSYMTSYLTLIDTISLTFFEICDLSFSGFDLDHWPSKVNRSQHVSTFQSPFMTSYLTFIDIFWLSRTVFEIFHFKLFKVWPWPLTLRSHLMSNYCSPFESPYMTSYLISINTFSLSCTVLRYLTSNFSGYALTFVL